MLSPKNRRTIFYVALLSSDDAYRLILGSFRGLLNQSKFNRNLIKRARDTSAADFEVAEFRGCTSTVRKEQKTDFQYGVYPVQIDGIVGGGFSISPDGLIVTAENGPVAYLLRIPRQSPRALNPKN